MIETAVVGSRPLTGAQAKVGDIVALHTPTGTWAYLIVGSDELPDGRIRLELVVEDGDPTEIKQRFLLDVAPGRRLFAMPSHYGVCAACGRVSPCPDEIFERMLERDFLADDAGSDS